MPELLLLAGGVFLLLTGYWGASLPAWSRGGTGGALRGFAGVSFILVFLVWAASTYNLATLTQPLGWAPTRGLIPQPGSPALGDGSLELVVPFLLAGGVTSLVFLCFLATRPLSLVLQTLPPLALILVSGAVFFCTQTLVVLLVGFELLLLASLYLLRQTSKSERVVDAGTEMFFWTLVGSLALLLVFGWLFSQGAVEVSDLLTSAALGDFWLLLLFVGFGVKIPLWPFFSWLLKAHVEASVEFSILLSGFIVKVGVFGVFRFMSFAAPTWAPLLLLAVSFLGIFMASCRLLAQRDLKRIVALTTVIEMNWVGLCLGLGDAGSLYVASYLVVAHSVTTALEFGVVELLSKRYGSRDVTQLSGVFSAAPLLGLVSFCSTLVTIGFPGTPLFLAKLLFFSTALAVAPWPFLVVALLLLVWTPLFFMRVWVPVWFGLPPQRPCYDLTASELALFGSLLSAAVFIAWAPALVVIL